MYKTEEQYISQEGREVLGVLTMLFGLGELGEGFPRFEMCGTAFGLECLSGGSTTAARAAGSWG